MLPRPIYEMMPFIYLVLGSTFVIGAEHDLMFIAGCALFIAGSMITFLRSEFRRIDEHELPENKLVVLPEYVYELLPFVYLLCSLLIIRFSDSRAAHVVAAILISYGMIRLYQRYRNRHVTSMKYHLKHGHHALHSLHQNNRHHHHSKHVRSEKL